MVGLMGWEVPPLGITHPFLFSGPVAVPQISRVGVRPIQVCHTGTFDVVHSLCTHCVWLSARNMGFFLSLT